MSREQLIGLIQSDAKFMDERDEIAGLPPEDWDNVIVATGPLTSEALAEAIVALKERVRLCSRCFAITEDDPCSICDDTRRDASIICVVGEAKDVFAIERTSAYHGRYHVLGGLISPMDGIGPSQLRVRELIERVTAESPAEVVIATNPNAEGEATALYLSRLLTPSGVNVTRLAYGLPIGGDLAYADENTLARAIEGRRTL